MLINLHTHISTGRTIELVNRTFEVKHEGIFSIGVHPWNCETYPNVKLELDYLSSEKQCLAIGEIGLDKLKGPDIEAQKNVFIAQLKLAEDKNLPVIIHCVRAWNELKAIKKEVNPSQQWIFHGFTKSGILSEVLNEKIMISIGAAILSNKKLQESISMIPNDRLFLETDDQDVPIEMIYEKVSELKKLTLQELEACIEHNFKRVFTKWKTGLNVQNC